MSDAYLTETLTKIEEVITEQEAKAKLGKALNYLFTLPEFELIIGKGYIVTQLDDAVTIVTNTLDPKSPEVREALDKIVGVNRFKEYIEGILEDAEYAPNRIEQEQDYRMEVTAEVSEG